jgi:hypothetical protein
VAEAWGRSRGSCRCAESSRGVPALCLASIDTKNLLHFVSPVPPLELHFSMTPLIIRTMDTTSPSQADNSIGGLLLGLLWTLAGISTCILGLRLYTGAFILHRLKVPDYLMIIAFVSAASFLTILCAKSSLQNRYALSSKLRSLPLPFTGGWADMSAFSTTIRRSTL